jgi:nitroimidazol reductase NimA-like FMN-containing flavoprotein (pyridoxamine 5'-phosphate oxidase superfamily)
MRRRDREVTSREEINKIILSCDCARLGFSCKTGAYIVPLNFGFTEKDGVRIFYFHSAKEGRKLDLIRENPAVGFELDTGHELNVGKEACAGSFKFQSVIGTGIVSIVGDEDERETALRFVMEHYTGKADWVFDDKALAHTEIIKLVVTDISCKKHD